MFRISVAKILLSLILLLSWSLWKQLASRKVFVNFARDSGVSPFIEMTPNLHFMQGPVHECKLLQQRWLTISG